MKVLRRFPRQSTEKWNREIIGGPHLSRMRHLLNLTGPTPRSTPMNLSQLQRFILNSSSMKVALAVMIFCAVISTPLTCIPDSSAQDLSSREQWGERFNSPQATLTYKETARNRNGAKTVVIYNLFASGLPKDKHYAFWVYNIGSNPRAVADAYLNQDGKVVNVLADPKRKISEDPIDLQAFGGKGEPIQVALISDDGNFRAFGEIVPFPIVETAGQCRLTAIEAAPRYEVMTIKVSGLEPGGDLLIDSQSENETVHSKAKADAQGNYRSLMVPAVAGKRSGKAQFSLTAKSCKIGVAFPWGDGSYLYQ